MYQSTTLSPVSSTDRSINELISQALMLGRARISTMAHRFYQEPLCGPASTADVISRDETLAARFMTVANTIQYGAGIAAVSIDSATVRMGNDRTKALALTFAMGRALSPIVGHVAGFDRLWYTAMARGALARALAMHCDARLAGPAFIATAMQDIGTVFFAAARPESYIDMVERSSGSSIRLALLEWQAFNRNHIHLGLEVLSGWGLPSFVTDAIGRHHTNPPVSTSNDLGVRLWQIGYLIGTLPLGAEGEVETSSPSVSRIFSKCFGVSEDETAQLLQQALDEYEDVVALFEPIIAPAQSGAELFAPAADALGVERPRAHRTSDDKKQSPEAPQTDRSYPPQLSLSGLFSTVRS